MTTSPIRPSFLTVAEVADICRVSKMTIYRLIHTGALEAHQFGRSYRIDTRDVHAWLRDTSTTADLDYAGGAA